MRLTKSAQWETAKLHAGDAACRPDQPTQSTERMRERKERVCVCASVAMCEIVQGALLWVPSAGVLEDGSRHASFCVASGTAGLIQTATPRFLPSRLCYCLLLMWKEARSLVKPLAAPGLLECMSEHEALPGKQEAPDSLTEQAVQRAQALAALPRCAHLACTNLAGASEAQLRMRLCSACRVSRYCSAACQLADWRAGHKRVCAALAAAQAAEEPSSPRGAEGQGTEAA